LFAMRKYKQVSEPIACAVDVQVGRNADKRLRVSAMRARLTIGVPAAGIEHLERILSTFEDFCTVTASVRQAFPVTVEVFDARGLQLK
jgi:organic hydroperoxide reductase OsmC/OhrA